MQLKYMPFGLVNALAIFCRMVIVQQPEGVTLQKYPQTRLLMILVEEVVYNQNLNDAQLTSLCCFELFKMASKMATLY